jgi:predicted Rossmann-fold nucleotide-binding protein
MQPVPVLLFGRSFWERIVNWDALAEAGTISDEDLDLFSYVESAEEAMTVIENWEVRPTRSSLPGRA